MKKKVKTSVLLAVFLLTATLSGCGDKNDVVEPGNTPGGGNNEMIPGDTPRDGGNKDDLVSEPLEEPELTCVWRADLWTLNGVHHSINEDNKFSDIPQFETATGEYFILKVSDDRGYAGLIEQADDGGYLLKNPEEGITMRAYIYIDQLQIYLPAEGEKEDTLSPDNCLTFTAFSGAKDESLISVERFKWFFDMEDTDIPDEYIENYIDRYGLCEEEMTACSLNFGARLQNDYAAGEDYGYSLEHKAVMQVSGPGNLGDPEYITIQLVIPAMGSDAFILESMVIDLKHMIMCYGGDESNYNMGSGVLIAELTQEDKDKLSEDFMAFSQVPVQSGNAAYDEYTYVITVIDTDGCWCEILRGNENDGSGFDPYFRELYKTYYGEECRYL